MPSSPTCTIDSYGSVCSKVHRSVTSILDLLRSSQPTATPTINVPEASMYLQPPCNIADTYPNPSAPITCSLEISTFKVLYWPVQTEGDFCSSQHITLPPNPTSKTASYSGKILTYPTVYYILDSVQLKTFAGLYHSNRASAWIAPKDRPPAPPITLLQDPQQTPVSSALISCNLGRQCFTTLREFAFEDLATVPASKYYGLIGGDDIIYQGWYAPYYTVPRPRPYP